MVAATDPSLAIPTAPNWVDINRPFATYDIAGGPYAKLPLRYTARRDEASSARQDTLTYGSPKPEESFLRLMFSRQDDETAPETSVFLDAARLAAGAGLAIVRSGLATSLTTRFGPFDVAGVAVSQGMRSADCFAFRRSGAQPVLQIVGIACGASDKPVDTVTLACTLDKIDLVSAGDDGDLRDLFVAAERRRGSGCMEAHGPGLHIGSSEAAKPLRGTLKGSLAVAR